MPTGGAGGGRHEFDLGFGRRHYAACSLASGGCRRVLGLEFRGVAERGGINRWGRADWVVPFVGHAAQRALTGRSYRVPGRAT
jgi:hypothetical protein